MFAPDVLVPELKANLQTRVCFPVADIDDSFLIVHEEGAEKLTAVQIAKKFGLRQSDFSAHFKKHRCYFTCVFQFLFNLMPY